MRVRILVSLLLVGIFLYGVSARAQAQHPLVGAWERISLNNAEGVDIQPPTPASFAIFSADGYYAVTPIPTGRDKLKKPLQDMTKEELLNRFQRLFDHHGTYTVSGNKLTRRHLAHSDPNAEGTELVQEFRIEGDLLILTRPESKAEARFRRAQKG